MTRILNASKLREMQRGGPSGAPPVSAAPPQPSPVHFSAPTVPAIPNLQWPPQVPPALSTGQLMHLGGGTQMPQIPQYTPPPLTITTPAPAAAPAMGKMQSYLPLLLVIIIFLLVVILVTLVFLLKH